nr:hypothetical protein CFP56_32231 [Quercus suber]
MSASFRLSTCLVRSALEGKEEAFRFLIHILINKGSPRNVASTDICRTYIPCRPRVGEKPRVRRGTEKQETGEFGNGAENYGGRRAGRK